MTLACSVNRCFKTVKIVPMLWAHCVKPHKRKRASVCTPGTHFEEGKTPKIDATFAFQAGHVVLSTSKANDAIAFATAMRVFTQETCLCLPAIPVCVNPLFHMLPTPHTTRLFPACCSAINHPHSSPPSTEWPMSQMCLWVRGGLHSHRYGWRLHSLPGTSSRNSF